MAWTVDARIPVTIVPPGPALDAALADGGPAALLCAGSLPSSAGSIAQADFVPGLPVHAAACVCCAGRSAAAAALDRLFQARVRGSCAWFARVVAMARTEAERAEVEAALRDDPVAAARFRLVA
jgi:hypothetical protein